MTILHKSEPDEAGMSVLRYVLDSEIASVQIKVAEATGGKTSSVEWANTSDPYQVGAPSNGDLWIMYVEPGQVVEPGEELFNISIMKQEKAVLAPVGGMVKRVLKDANYTDDKKMVPVVEGELLVELGPIPQTCPTCNMHIVDENFTFCPGCGQKL